MNALVTGGAGFIGSHVAEALIAAGAATRVLDDLSTGYRDNVPARAEFLEGDITDEATMRKAVDGIDVVFHHAAYRAVLRSVEHPLAVDRINTYGTLNVLHAARDAGVRRVVHASSSSVYGGAAEVPTSETAPLIPRSPYAVSKLAAEHYCRLYCDLYGVETVALRYFNVYGPRQRPESAYAAVIPLFIEALSDGVPAVVHSDGVQSRDFTFVSDVVSANLAAASAPASSCSGKAYNVAGGGAYSLLDVLGMLGAILGCEPKWTHTDARAGDVRHSLADISAASRDLGHDPRVTIRDGLRSTVDWFARRRRPVTLP